MANRRNSVCIAFLAIGLVPLWLASCGGGETTGTGTGGTGNPGTAGSGNSGTAGTGNPGTAGTSNAGTAGTQGNGGSTSTGSAGNGPGAGGSGPGSGGNGPGAGGSGPGSGGDGEGGSGPGAGGSGPGSGGNGPGVGGSGPAGRGGTTGSAGRGGTTGTAGSTGSGGRGGTTGTAGSTGSGGATGDACPSGTSATFGCGKPRTMGFMGCSMSVYVATGYQRRMGMRMWEPVSAYGGQVVQSWTPASGGVWTSFDQKATQYGKPTDIWMQICIFAQQGVTAAEVQTMIKNARAHSTPTTRIWITGQPTYETGHTCSLAGTGGTELTDMRAKEAENQANGVYYAGTFKIDSTKGEVSSDTCHASSAGELTLGDQFIAKFGM